MLRALAVSTTLLGSACLLPDLSDLTRCSDGDCGTAGGGASSVGGGLVITCTDEVIAFPMGELAGLSFDTSAPEDVLRRDLQVDGDRVLALARRGSDGFMPVLVDFASRAVLNQDQAPLQDGGLVSIALGPAGTPFYSASPGKLWKSDELSTYGVDPQGIAGLTAIALDPDPNHPESLFLALEKGATETEIRWVETELPTPPMHLVATFSGQPAGPMRVFPTSAGARRLVVRLRDRVVTCTLQGDGAAQSCADVRTFQQTSPTSGEPWQLDAAGWAPNETTDLLDLVLVERRGEAAARPEDPAAGRLSWFPGEAETGSIVLPDRLWRGSAAAIMQSVAPEIAFAAEVSTSTGSQPILARCPLRAEIPASLEGCSCVPTPATATAIASDPKTQAFYFQSGATIYQWPSPP